MFSSLMVNGGSSFHTQGGGKDHLKKLLGPLLHKKGRFPLSQEDAGHMTSSSRFGEIARRVGSR